jgi:hypothetical protein
MAGDANVVIAEEINTIAVNTAANAVFVRVFMTLCFKVFFVFINETPSTLKRFSGFCPIIPP